MIPFLRVRRSPASQPAAPVHTRPLDSAVVDPVRTTPLAPAPDRADRALISAPTWEPIAAPRREAPPLFKTSRTLLAQAKQRLEAKLAQARRQLDLAMTPDQREWAKAQIADAERRLALLERLGASLTRATRDPATSQADAERLRSLVAAATDERVGFADLRRAVLRAERLVEGIGWVAGPGRALDEAVVGLRERQAQLQDQLTELEQALAKASSGFERLAVERRMGDLRGKLREIDRALSSVEKLAERLDVSPEEIADAQKRVDALLGKAVKQDDGPGGGGGRLRTRNLC